jgi:V8-like Glu-specific endopeptidase
MSLRWRVSTGVAAACAAVCASAPAAGAEDAAAAVPQTPQAIRDYWTPERMREARPIEEVISGSGAIPVDPGSEAAAKRGGSNAAPVLRRKRFPKRTHGKVYLTLNPGGNFVCSGTAVHAPNDSLVLTAGHCTFGCESVLGCTPRRATNFNFVPAFKDGDKPFGEWPAQAVRATPQYESNENLAYDVGAAVIAPRGGREIEEVLGGARRIAFNPDWDQRYRVFGYPVQGQYTGSQAPFVCSVRATGRDHSLSPPSTRIPCDMTGGASGGGWVTDGGKVASVTSYSYRTQTDTLYGPYFGSAIRNFYDSVKNG